MKKVYLICLLLTVTGLSFAQLPFRVFTDQEGKAHIFPRFKSMDFTMPGISYTNLYYTQKTPDLEMTWPENSYTKPLAFADRPMDMQILSGAYRPFFNAYTPMLIRTNPFAFDFFEAYQYKINNHTAFTVTGLQSTWPGSGRIHTVSTGIAWNQDRLSLWGGGFAGRYATPFDLSPGVMGGFYAGASYQATEWLKLNAWGEYTIYDKAGKENMFLYSDLFHKKTSVGGSMEFKVSDSFGFGIGMQHNYNPIHQKWERQQLIYPVIHSKKFGISVNPF